MYTLLVLAGCEYLSPRRHYSEWVFTNGYVGYELLI